MSTFKPLEALPDALATLKKATKIEISLLVNPESSTHLKSLNAAYYNAQDAGYIMSSRVNGDRVWELTEKGKAKQQGKEFRLGKIVERITQADVDKTIAQINPIQQAKPSKSRPDNFGVIFNNDSKLIIWNGDDEVVFNPAEAAQVIAFIANQMPWIEYVKLHGVAA